MSDKERLDWIEETVNREGCLLLHNGKNDHGILGLGFGPDSAFARDLRGAIDGVLLAPSGHGEGTDAKPEHPDELNKWFNNKEKPL